jgi:hypothetical protein
MGLLPIEWVAMALFHPFFLHPGSQTAQACHNYSWFLWPSSADQVRFRFARACQIGDFPVLLPGMLMRRSVHGMQGALGTARPRPCSALPQTPGSSVRRACGKHAGCGIERPPSPLSSASVGEALPGRAQMDSYSCHHSACLARRSHRAAQNRTDQKSFLCV